MGGACPSRLIWIFSEGAGPSPAKIYDWEGNPIDEQLKAIELRYQELEARLAANETYSDPELVSRLNREIGRAHV